MTGVFLPAAVAPNPDHRPFEDRLSASLLERCSKDLLAIKWMACTPPRFKVIYILHFPAIGPLRNRGITYNGIEQISKMPSSCWIQHAARYFTYLLHLCNGPRPTRHSCLVDPSFSTDLYAPDICLCPNLWKRIQEVFLSGATQAVMCSRSRNTQEIPANS